ncbi:MAG: oxidoreductase [Lentisphaerae bacterium GWF2_52_8]|nr:MAG: oxidoreductase [Lentisphaerae bacterium GWF2_52_8]
MKKFNVALVGCGRIASSHFESLKFLSHDCHLTAVCDCVPVRAAEAAEKYGAKAYTDYDKMLKEAEADIVAIATPSGMHPEMGVKAAMAGKHVISEKPMAVSLEGADKLIKACHDAKVSLFVVKQNRLNPTMQLLKRAVMKGRFGNIYAIHVNVFWQRPQSYYDLAPWRGTKVMDGGAFLNQASHYVDSLHWLGGEIISVSGYLGTLARKIETEDTGSAILRFASGAFGSMNVTMLTYPKNLEGSITVLGENGTVRVGGVAINQIQHWEFSDYDDDDGLIEKSNYNPPNVYGHGHIPYYKNVFAALRGEQTPETDGNEGRKSLEVILAIYKSSEEGRSISLPLK